MLVCAQDHIVSCYATRMAATAQCSSLGGYASCSRHVLLGRFWRTVTPVTDGWAWSDALGKHYLTGYMF